MRKSWMAAITVVLLTFSNIASAAPNISKVKAGATCNKLNQTQVVNSIKYTCINSHKKLVWNKGVRTVTPKPSTKPSPAPTSSPTPSASSNNSASPEPSPNVTATKSPNTSPTTYTKKQPINKEDFYYRDLLFNAWQQQLVLKSGDIKPEIIKYVDPKFPMVSFESISAGMNNVLQKYGYLIKPNIRLHVIFSSSYEFEMSSINGNSELQADYLKEDPNWSRHIWRIEQYKSAHFVSGGTYPISGTSSYVIYFRQSTDMASDDWRYLGAHETTHLIQWMINGNFPKVLPAWWIEGQAQQVEEVLGNVKQTTESIDDEMLRLKGHFGPPFLANSPDGKDFSNMEGDPDTRTEFGCKLCATDLIYSRGKLAIDYLISTYSHEKVINFMGSLSTNNLWWQSFQSTFGISVADFYKKLEDLIDWYGNYYVSS